MGALQLACVFVMTYYLASAIQVVFHRLFGHARRIDRIFRDHALGHHARYPRNDLLREQWHPSQRSVLRYLMLPFVPIVATAWFVLPPPHFLVHALGLAFAVVWHMYLHRQYHLARSLLNRFAWFRRKRELHFVHHRRVHSNYAIVEFWIDRLLGTYRAA